MACYLSGKLSFAPQTVSPTQRITWSKKLLVCSQLGDSLLHVDTSYLFETLYTNDCQ